MRTQIEHRKAQIETIASMALSRKRERGNLQTSSLPLFSSLQEIEGLDARTFHLSAHFLSILLLLQVTGRGQPCACARPFYG